MMAWTQNIDQTWYATYQELGIKSIRLFHITKKASMSLRHFLDKDAQTFSKWCVTEAAVKLKVPLLVLPCCPFKWTTKPHFPWCCPPRQPVLPPPGFTTCMGRIWAPSGLCDSQSPQLRCLPHSFIAGTVNHYAHALQHLTAPRVQRAFNCCLHMKKNYCSRTSTSVHQTLIYCKLVQTPTT